MQWLLFHWDPAHRVALSSNDAKKDDKDGTKKAGSLSDIFNVV